MALSRRLLRENPHIAAWHFHSRAQAFRNVVLKDKFNMVDFWSRAGAVVTHMACFGLKAAHLPK